MKAIGFLVHLDKAEDRSILQSSIQVTCCILNLMMKKKSAYT